MANAADQPCEEQLNFAEKYVVEKHVRETIMPWLKWVGIGNLAAILALFGYVIIWTGNLASDTARERLRCSSKKWKKTWMSELAT